MSFNSFPGKAETEYLKKILRTYELFIMQPYMTLAVH